MKKYLWNINMICNEVYDMFVLKYDEFKYLGQFWMVRMNYLWPQTAKKGVELLRNDWTWEYSRNMLSFRFSLTYLNRTFFGRKKLNI